jgi:hypothetical protein
MLYKATSPRRLQLWGLGAFEKDEAREVELDEAQVRSLEARGFDLLPLGDEPGPATLEEDEPDQDAGEEPDEEEED